MKLLLSRHGNTFGPDDKVVWTGTQNDLPLVESGILQAQALGTALAEASIFPDAVYASKLQRVYDYAVIALEEAGLELRPIIDERLLEIDYGSWTGLSNDEVEAEFGKEALEEWNTKSKWPEESDWQPGETKMIAMVHDFTRDLLAKHKGQTVLVVSSNGTLRYFLTLKDGLYEKQVAAGNFKVKTGNTCLLEFRDAWQLGFWNQKPSEWESELHPRNK